MERTDTVAPVGRIGNTMGKKQDSHENLSSILSRRGSTRPMTLQPGEFHAQATKPARHGVGRSENAARAESAWLWSNSDSNSACPGTRPSRPAVGAVRDPIPRGGYKTRTAGDHAG